MTTIRRIYAYLLAFAGLAMVSLAGALTTFSPKLRPRDLPLYVHDSLGPVFAELDEKLHTLLETVVATNRPSCPGTRSTTGLPSGVKS